MVIPTMLTELIIHNFAIIDNLRISFAPGFTVLTGETGAGKSIILDAVSLDPWWPGRQQHGARRQ